MEGKLMKYYLSLLCCVMLSPLFGEVVGNVEFQLPQMTPEWVRDKRLENEKGLTQIYVPESFNDKSQDIGDDQDNESDKNIKEFFGVNSNKLKTNLNDLTSFRTALTKLFPNQQIDLQILEKRTDSILYEWTAKANGLERVHAWTRAFSTPNGTVVLMYQTDNIREITKARAIWLPVLREAKIVEEKK